MAYTEIVFKETVLEFSGILDFKEFLKTLREFFKRHDYDVNEKNYHSKPKDGFKNMKIVWVCDRKYDDYNEAVVKIKIEMNNYKESTGKKLVEGDLKVSIVGEMNRDYGNKWTQNVFKIFIRSLYDKYISGIKSGAADKELKKVIDGLNYEVKQYLQI